MEDGYSAAARLAELLFEVLQERSFRSVPGTVRSADLAQVLQALRDHAKGEELLDDLHQGVSSWSQDREVSKQEFLSTMQETVRVVGRRAYGAALRSQIFLASASAPATPARSSTCTPRAAGRCVPSHAPVTKLPVPRMPSPQRLRLRSRPTPVFVEEGPSGAAQDLPSVLEESSERPDSSSSDPGKAAAGACEPWDLRVFPRSTSDADRKRSRHLDRLSLSKLTPSAVKQDGFITAPPTPTGIGLMEGSTSSHRSAASDGGNRLRAITDQRWDKGGKLLRIPVASPACSSSVSAKWPISPSHSEHIAIPSEGVDPAREREGSVFTSESHLQRWHLPEETLLVFDWDDTLCPTTFIREDPRLSWRTSAPCFEAEPTMPLDPQDNGQAGNLTMAEALHRHVAVTSTMLRLARTCGKVVIVTLARKGWVETSLENFLPGLLPVLAELAVEVIYARDVLHGWQVRGAALDDMDIWSLMKETAMRIAIKKLYSSHKGQSWKNVISIGDSETEKDALIEVIFRHSQQDRDGAEKRCRCKTVKLQEDPDLPHLTEELEVLVAWLHPLTAYDDDLKLDLADTDGSLSILEQVLQNYERPMSAVSGKTEGESTFFPETSVNDGQPVTS